VTQFIFYLLDYIDEVWPILFGHPWLAFHLTPLKGKVTGRVKPAFAPIVISRLMARLT
jgi:hypothetical protein